MNAAKQIASKQWARRLTEKANRSTFAFLSALGLLYKSGQLTREEVLEHLKAAGITREDLRRFRAWRSAT